MMRSVRILAAKCEPFGDRRDAERGGARAECCARDVDRAVAVGIRLDDGPQAGSVERTQQRSHIAPQRAEVDRDLGAVHQPSANGRDSMTSEAIRPTWWGASAAARP